MVNVTDLFFPFITGFFKKKKMFVDIFFFFFFKRSSFIFKFNFDKETWMRGFLFIYLFFILKETFFFNYLKFRT